MHLPLTTRILLPIAISLGLACLLMAWAMTSSLHRAHEQAIATRLDKRIAWMVAALEIDHDDNEIEAEFAAELPSLAEFWRIESSSGELLWHGDWASAGDQPLRLQSHRILDSADRPLSIKNGHDRHHPLNAAPRPLGALVCIAATATHGEEAEAQRLQTQLAIGLPLFFCCSLGLCLLIVRRELKPLQVIASQAAAIDVGQLDNDSGFSPPTAHSREITQLSRSLGDMLTRLGHSLEREREFSRAAAHELRTPLAQLCAELEIALRSERDSDSYRQIIAAALADGRRLSALVAAILAWSRNQSVPSDGCRLDQLCATSQAEGLSLDLPAGAAPALRVSADCTVIQIIIRNLVDNARHHAGETPDGSLALGADHLILTISDHGPGIPPADRERIFNPLVRLDEARTIDPAATHDGFGLGLAITHKALRQIGGSISCTDRPDGQPGACFIVRLPLHRPADGATDKQS